MPSQSVSSELLLAIQRGHAVAVVGSEGLLDWKKVLRKVVKSGTGDESIAGEVDALLSAGRTREVIDYVADGGAGAELRTALGKAWVDKTETANKRLDEADEMGLPVWTTIPAEVIKSTDGKVVSLTGDTKTGAVSPSSLVAQVATWENLDSIAKPLFVFIGFSPEDPYLSSVLEALRVAFDGRVEAHCLVDTVSEIRKHDLRTRYGVEISTGHGSDFKQVVVSLTQGRSQKGTPAANDLAGWARVLATSPKDELAIASLLAIANESEIAGDYGQATQALIAILEVAADHPKRSAWFKELATLFEEKVGDENRALATIATALREAPGDTELLAKAQMLAEKTNSWNDLVGDVAYIVDDTNDSVLAAKLCCHLGGWYDNHLGRLDYAEASYREALARDPHNHGAALGLEECARKSGSWAELATLLEKRIAKTSDAAVELDLQFALGELYEGQLADSKKAILAFERAAELEQGTDDALGALARLYRRQERWGKLASVLEKQADVLHGNGQSGRAAVVRRELAELNVDKLGDVDGAITRYEAALELDPASISARRSLMELYDRSGRSKEYFACLEKLVDVCPGRERTSLRLRLAAELEEGAEGTAKAHGQYQALLKEEPGSDIALAGFKRSMQGDWKEYAAVLQSFAMAKEGEAKAAAFAELGAIQRDKLDHTGNAIEAFEASISAHSTDGVRTQLINLYRDNEDWGRYRDSLVELAEGSSGAIAAQYWLTVGDLCLSKISEPERATKAFEIVLATDPQNLTAREGLVKALVQSKSWTQAADGWEELAEVFSEPKRKVHALVAAANVAGNSLGDNQRSLALMRKAYDIDPGQSDVRKNLGMALVKSGKLDEAADILNHVANDTALTSEDRAEHRLELAKVQERLGKLNDALCSFREAALDDPSSIACSVGVCRVLSAQIEKSSDRDGEFWRDVILSSKRALELVTEPSTRGNILWLLGRAELRTGAKKEAQKTVLDASKLKPGRADIRKLAIQLAESTEDWSSVHEIAKSALDNQIALPEEAPFLWQTVGDVHTRKQDTPSALAAYGQALRLAPSDLGVLHRILDGQTETKAWAAAVETLTAIEVAVSDPVQQCKVQYATAMIARDELGNADLAIAKLEEAFANDPSDAKVLAALERTFKDGDSSKLLGLYQTVLEKAADSLAPLEQARLWKQVGRLSDEAGDVETATASYEVAATLDPEDTSVQTELAEIYLAGGDETRQEAIGAMHALLAADPDRVEFYRGLSDLYRAEKNEDACFCLAQALVLLGHASPEEKQLVSKARPDGLVAASRKMTPDAWQLVLPHKHERTGARDLFGAAFPVLPEAYGAPLAAFDLNNSDEVAVSEDSSALARVLQYAIEIANVSKQPRLFSSQSATTLRLANLFEANTLSPALVAPLGMLRAMDDEKALAFQVGARLAYLLPERWAFVAFPTPSELETVAKEVVSIVSGKKQASWTSRLSPAAQNAMVDALASIDLGELDTALTDWRDAADLTAARFGLALSNDLAVAAEQVAMADSLSSLTTVERVRELVAFAVSKDYLALRRHLGLAIGA